MELRALLLLPLCFPGLQAQTLVLEEKKIERSALYVQCPYTEQVKYQQKKAWCRWRDGQCEPLVDTTYSTQYANAKRATNGKVVIEDNRTKRIVNITITNLQVEDSGTYSCAYYSGYRYVLLKTISLTVFKELYKSELDSVSVQCPYSTAVDGTLVYSTDVKAWCLLDQTWCNILGWTDGPSTQNHRKAQQGRVLIQDDTKKRTVTITMQKLQTRDTGVYQCVLYSHTHLIPIMEVKLSVSKLSVETTLSGSAGTTQTTPAGNTSELSSSANTFVLLAGVLSILFLLALIGSITLWVRRCKQLKRRGMWRLPEDIYDKPEDIVQLDSTDRMESPQDDSKDLKYVTLNFKSRLSPEDPLYCNVEPRQAHRKPEDEHVEYATIALK
ncbi:TREM1 protein, partial [Caloenas nicobarica]|nr:TREM1 protein [Caloenas nicobarica]